MDGVLPLWAFDSLDLNDLCVSETRSLPPFPKQETNSAWAAWMFCLQIRGWSSSLDASWSSHTHTRSVWPRCIYFCSSASSLVGWHGSRQPHSKTFCTLGTQTSQLITNALRWSNKPWFSSLFVRLLMLSGAVSLGVFILMLSFSLNNLIKHYHFYGNCSF